MNRIIPLLIIVIFSDVLSCRAAPARKRTISIGEARVEMGIVAAYQEFPSNYRIDRFGVLEVEDEYFHVFTCYLPKPRKWRTLVFSNNGSYLGYYETSDKPAESDKETLVFPGPDYSSESGDYEEGAFDSGNARIVKFSAAGPPDEVKFENVTFSFVSSPARIRPADPAYRFIQLANRVTDSVNRSRYKQVRDDFSDRALRRISEQHTVEVLTNVRKKLGRIERVGTPWVQSKNTAVLPITFERAEAGLKLMITEDGKIDGMWILPFKSAFPDIGKNKMILTLPFDSRWRALWGGDSRDQSKYFGSRVGHYALEFVVSNRFGKTYANEGRKNKNYFAFGQAIRAPAAGTVVAVIKGVEDNKPHSPNPFDQLGNAIMIQHSTNEFSVVGHLMNNSMRVRVGDQVQPRQLIAQCGNSGDSSQPSLYFHVQDSPSILSGSGYCTRFNTVYVTKQGRTELVEQYSPVRGDFVMQQSIPKKALSSGEGSQSKAIGQ
ncbi:MAG: peptidoglycan DD-metalloendopeptidase family protein [Pontiella sp.]